MPLDLVLVRHGESEGNVANRRSKRGDDSLYSDEFLSRHSSQWRLTDKGIAQAQQAGKWIRANLGGFDRYYVSEYLRAKETAYHLQLPEASWNAEIYLRERDWGALDVMTVADREREYAHSMRRRDIDPFFWGPPSGESLAQLCLRVDRVLDTLHRETEGQRVIIVCHGEVMWAFRMRLERLSVQRFLELDASREPYDEIHNCQVLHYSRRDPESGDTVPYLQWVRSTCPWRLENSVHRWERIERRRLDNAALKAEVDAVPRLISDDPA